jgi:hypothetical protein
MMRDFGKKRLMSARNAKKHGTVRSMGGAIGLFKKSSKRKKTAGIRPGLSSQGKCISPGQSILSGQAEEL